MRTPSFPTKEEKTAALVAKELRAAGCEVTEQVGKYDKPRPDQLRRRRDDEKWRRPDRVVRTDLDGLPVKEETGLPYASKVTTKNERARTSR